MEALQNHILQANCTKVHKHISIKMATSAVSMVFHFEVCFWKVSITQLWEFLHGQQNRYGVIYNNNHNL